MVVRGLKQVFLIGVGGIGMSALARYFKHLGAYVQGYDKTETSLTKQLVAEGIAVFYDDDVDKVAFAFRELSDESLIIYTPAVPGNLQIVEFFKNTGYRLYKRSEILGLISREHYTIAVAGTHGKTTTSTMIAHALKDSGYGCSAFLGGISVNYDNNVLFSDNDTLVVEADEFDRSFLTLHPNIAIVTSTDADHLDVYGDAGHVLESFNLFVKQVAADGTRIIKKGLSLPADVHYSASESSDAYAANIRIEDRSFYFDYTADNYTIKDLQLGIAGRHNIENAVAAITAVRLLGLNERQIKQAMASFKGVKRRFEYVVSRQDCVYIDDYAHHPEELRACLKTIKELFPEEEITCVFQPHLFTRTRDFVDEFAAVLELADILILMDIYPAREQPIDGVSSDWLLGKVHLDRKKKLSNKEVLAYIGKEKPKVLVTVGAGDIDLLVTPIKRVLTNVE